LLPRLAGSSGAVAFEHPISPGSWDRAPQPLGDPIEGGDGSGNLTTFARRWIGLDAAWYGDAPNKRCVRVREGGEVLQTIDLDRGCFGCMLGGPDGRTLFMVAVECPGHGGRSTNGAGADGRRRPSVGRRQRNTIHGCVRRREEIWTKWRETSSRR
jgi:hypothetical protein